MKFAVIQRNVTGKPVKFRETSKGLVLLDIK